MLYTFLAAQRGRFLSEKTIDVDRHKTVSSCCAPRHPAIESAGATADFSDHFPRLEVRGIHEVANYPHIPRCMATRFKASDHPHGGAAQSNGAIPRAEWRDDRLPWRRRHTEREEQQ